MSSDSVFFTGAIILILLFAAALSPGCSSNDTESCNATLAELDSIEKSADGRLKIMDFSNTDEIFSSQLAASKSQYRDAIDLLYSLGPSPCLSGFAYETRVKSLQLKIDFLDVYSAMYENDQKAGRIFHTTTPEFRKGLVEVMDEYENIRQRILFLQVLGRDIDRTLLDPQFTGTIGTVRGELDMRLDSVEAKISFLMEYR